MNKSETIRRITNEDGNFLTVGPSDSFSGHVLVDADYNVWGFSGLCMKPEFARTLGEALIKCCDEIDPTKDCSRSWWRAKD